MSGVPQIQYVIVDLFGSAAIDPTDITLPIPVASQVGVLVGAASFEDGFPPATRADPLTEGGVPPFGQDMNGILYMLSAYCRQAQAGQRSSWDVSAAGAFVGYAIGAELASVSVPGRYFTNVVDGNIADPDIDETGWASSDPQYAQLAPAAGQLDNLDLPGASDYALDIDTSAGPVDITGFVAQRNGQKLFVSCTGANLLQFMANNAGSDPVNQIRAATDLALIENQTLTLQWFSGLDRWLLV